MIKNPFLQIAEFLTKYSPSIKIILKKLLQQTNYYEGTYDKVVMGSHNENKITQETIQNLKTMEQRLIDFYYSFKFQIVESEIHLIIDDKKKISSSNTIFKLNEN